MNKLSWVQMAWKCVFTSLVSPSETGQSFNYNSLIFGTLQLKFNQIQFFINTLSHLMVLCNKKIEKLEFFEGVNFEFIDSLKNNDSHYL